MNTEVICASCGSTIDDAASRNAYLVRVNEKGVKGIFECSDGCVDCLPVSSPDEVDDIAPVPTEETESNIRKHAMREFKAAGWLEEPVDDMQQSIMDHLLVMCDAFAAEGHSGFSANYTINCLTKLLKFEPLVPLTGEDWEWNEVGSTCDSPVEVYQNNRCSHVFKQSDRFDGQAYDTNGKVFWEWYERELDEDEEGYPGTYRDKSYFTNSESFVPITFPYTSVTVYEERQLEKE